MLGRRQATVDGALAASVELDEEPWSGFRASGCVRKPIAHVSCGAPNL